ncbi:MAG: hypothetical protein RL238_3313 [Actinomycetota bacterium]
MPVEPVMPQPTLSDEHYEALLATCDVRTWIGKRDRAILTAFESTGCRVSELAAFRVGDVDLQTAEILVREPKRDRSGLARMRYVYLNDLATIALASWMRVRESGAHDDSLWLASNGDRLTSNGIQQMLRRRGERLGIVVSAHPFRRRLATKWLLDGGSEAGLKKMGGWQSSIMPSRYAAAGLAEIARADHARIFGSRRDRPR